MTCTILMIVAVVLTNCASVESIKHTQGAGIKRTYDNTVLEV